MSIKIYGNKNKGFFINQNGTELNVEPFKTKRQAEKFFELHYGLTYKKYKEVIKCLISNKC